MQMMQVRWSLESAQGKRKSTATDCVHPSKRKRKPVKGEQPDQLDERVGAPVLAVPTSATAAYYAMALAAQQQTQQQLTPHRCDMHHGSSKSACRIPVYYNCSPHPARMRTQAHAYCSAWPHADMVRRTVTRWRYGVRAQLEPTPFQRGSQTSTWLRPVAMAERDGSLAKRAGSLDGRWPA